MIQKQSLQNKSNIDTNNELISIAPNYITVIIWQLPIISEVNDQTILKHRAANK